MKLRDRLLSPLAVVALLLGGLVVVAPAQAAEEVYPAPASGAWTADGHGYGHGRGMSQWGAQGAAVQGRSTDEILTFYYPGTTAANIGAPFVEVSLSAFSPASSVTIWSPENRPIRMGNLNAEVWRAAGRWTVTAAGQQVTAVRRATINGPVLEAHTYTGTLRLESGAEYGMVIAASQTATTGRWHRGDLRVNPTSGTGFNVTNWLPMEQYLRSVVPRESPASWGAAALRAQAIAARSYAQYKVKHGSALCDTTSCQVYYGRGDADSAGNLTYSWEDSRTDDAIAATAGRVQNWAGSVAFTEFSSSSGGWTTASSVPYQVAKSDPWSGAAPGDTVSSWSTTLTVAAVAKSCPGTGGILRNLVIVARNGNGDLGGRVTQARVECSTGNATVYTPSFGLRSSWWKLRVVAPTLALPAQSATVIDYGAQMSLAVTPNVGVTWTLTVKDHSTGRTALTRTGTALAGVRFNATWFGTYAPVAAGDPGYVGPGTYDLALSAVDSAGKATNVYRTSVQVRRPADPVLVSAVPLVADAGYVAVTPARLVDTRTNFQSLGAAQRADVKVLGKAGVPSTGVSAVVLNVTAVGASTDTHLRVWPAGAGLPQASALNSDSRRTQAGLVTVGVGGGGKFSVYNAAGTTHYVVDVLGYYTTTLASSARFAGVDPVRALDSRSAAPIAGGVTRQIDVAAALGIPKAQIGAVTANVTVTQARGNGYVVAYGAGALPVTSTVNFIPGADVANRTVVPVVDGKITVAVVGSTTDLLVDLVGWYARPGVASGSLFTPIVPTRLLDSRTTTAFRAGETRSLVVTGAVVPVGAQAVVGTLTVAGQTASTTYAKVWPNGSPWTATSDVNSGRGRTQANAVVMRIGTGNAVQLYNDQGSSQLILDAVGYFD